MRINKTPLTINGWILLSIAIVDRWVLDDRAAFNVEWVGALILFALASAIREED